MSILPLTIDFQYHYRSLWLMVEKSFSTAGSFMMVVEETGGRLSGHADFHINTAAGGKGRIK